MRTTSSCWRAWGPSEGPPTLEAVELEQGLGEGEELPYLTAERWKAEKDSLPSCRLLAQVSYTQVLSSRP